MAFLLPIYISLVCLGLTPGLFGTAAHAGKHEVKGLGKGPRCVDTEGNVARPVCTCELADGSKVDCRSGDCPGKEAKSFDCPEDGAVLNYGDYNLKYTCPGEEVLSCSCGGMEEVAETPPFMDCTQCPSREWNLECTGGVEPQRRRKPFNPKRWICTDDSEPKCTCTETKGDANSSDDSCVNCRRKYRQVMCEDGTEAERKKRAKKFE